MTSPDADAIADMPIHNLMVSGAIILNWHDGPVHGFIRISTPSTAWRFNLTVNRIEADGSDNRLYLLAEFPLKHWNQLVAALSGPADPPLVWIPEWQFETDDAERAADAIVDRIETAATKRGAELLIRATSITEIQEVWRWQSWPERQSD